MRRAVTRVPKKFLIAQAVGAFAAGALAARPELLRSFHPGPVFVVSLVTFVVVVFVVFVVLALRSAKRLAAQSKRSC